MGSGLGRKKIYRRTRTGANFLWIKYSYSRAKGETGRSLWEMEDLVRGRENKKEKVRGDESLRKRGRSDRG